MNEIHAHRSTPGEDVAALHRTINELVALVNELKAKFNAHTHGTKGAALDEAQQVAHEDAPIVVIGGKR